MHCAPNNVTFFHTCVCRAKYFGLFIALQVLDCLAVNQCDLAEKNLQLVPALICALHMHACARHFSAHLRMRSDQACMHCERSRYSKHDRVDKS